MKLQVDHFDQVSVEFIELLLNEAATSVPQFSFSIVFRPFDDDYAYLYSMSAGFPFYKTLASPPMLLELNMPG